MNFKTWIENAGDPYASAEVVKTGLQPQVDSEEINTQQKRDYKFISDISDQVEKLRVATEEIDESSSEKLKAIRGLVKRFVEDWDSLKNKGQDIPNAFKNPTDQDINYMTQNQPLPELPKLPGPGTFGNS